MEADRPRSMSRPTSGTSGNRHLSQKKAEATAATTVVETVSSIASDTAESEKSGQPDDPGLTGNRIHDWKRDGDGVPYHKKGPKSFDVVLQNVYWNQSATKYATGYIDPSWTRPTNSPTQKELTEFDGRLNRFGDINAEMPEDCESRGISAAD